MLAGDYNALVAAVGKQGIIDGVLRSLRNVTNTDDLTVDVRPGSILVTVFGPTASLDSINTAVASGNFTVEVNGQTLQASTFVASPADSGDDDDLSDGAIVGIFFGVLAGVVLLVGVVVWRYKATRERGSYEVDEAAHADTIVTEVDNYVPTVSDNMWDTEKPVYLLNMNVNPRMGTAV